MRGVSSYTRIYECRSSRRDRALKMGIPSLGGDSAQTSWVEMKILTESPSGLAVRGLGYKYAPASIGLCTDE